MTGTIIGNQNPMVGKAYPYEIQPSGLSFGLKGEYEWHLYKKQKNGTWKDITNQPKTGEKVTYNFGEIALGIEFQMKVYETKKGIFPGLPATKELAATFILIPTSNKVPKIDKVILFNRGGKDVNKASYRDTLIAQAHCIAMFNKEIEFHLWEDDAPGKGHDPNINKNNRHTRSYKALVNEKGIAEVPIPLMSDEKILRQVANQFMMKGDKNEGANHEYYVTATYSGKIQGASQVNVDVANPDYKGQPQNQPKPQPKPQNQNQPQQHTPKFTPGQGGGPKQPDPKGNIIEAVFIDDTGKELSKVAVGDKVRVRIHSKNMVGKHIQYVVWEYDTTSNDEVYRSGNIKIPADVCDTSGFIISKDIFEKGIGSPIGDPDADKQNYFIEIISKDLSAESQKFGVNSEGLMEVEKVKSAAGVQKQNKNQTGEKCFCNRDFEEKDVKQLVKLLKGTETIWEGQALKGGKRAPCNISDKSFATLTKGLNSAFKKYNINTCIQKIHFLAQACEETGTFALSEETKSDYLSSQSIYKGRGLLQLTGVRTDEKDLTTLFNKPGPYKDYADYKNDQNIVKNPSILANNADYCIDSGAWIWSVNKKMTSNPKSDAITKWGKETLGKSLNELALYGDKYLELISVLLNGRNSETEMPNGWQIRKNNYDLLKTGFFICNKFHGNTSPSTPVNAKDIVTYHIFANGDIEKHIPKNIKLENQYLYQYIYHDKNNKEHVICKAEWHITQEKLNGQKPGIKPTHSKILSDIPVSDGQTKRRVKYQNGDIAEYGTNEGKSFWVLYKVTGRKIELVKMPDSLNYNNSGISIKYSFTNTKRRYTEPGHLAVFIGVLAECGYSDVQTTGSCFSEASCFPSVEHVNGKSIDTLYLDDIREQKLINAFHKFGITKQLRGSKKKAFTHTTDGKKLHNSHLHSGIIAPGKIKIIKE
ncbi:MAG: hypothetical protein ACN6OJ_01470 [Chryseobacterium sp.]|uniref:hypothetical protein n=1 Tax=Chryseobacterium sp. TaxID=1871047 RepID=UPI003D12DA08